MPTNRSSRRILPRHGRPRSRARRSLRATGHVRRAEVREPGEQIVLSTSGANSHLRFDTPLMLLETHWVQRICASNFFLPSVADSSCRDMNARPAVCAGYHLPMCAPQHKYLLKSPSGIAFSDFSGYEDWAVVSSARTDEVLKVIVANPTMIKAYKAGVRGNGQPFPDRSMIVKLQWKPKKGTEAPFAVDAPDVFTQTFVIEKDSKRFPKSAGWGYAVFNYEAA